MSLPSVHVIILNWNGLADTLGCLESFREQDYPNLQFCVVDNGSEPGEADAIEKQFPEVEILRQGRNLGFCGGNNVGIRRALEKGADYVLVLNNDTIATTSLVSTLVSHAEKLPFLGALSPVILNYPQQDLIWFAGSEWETATAGFRHRLSGRPRNELTAREPFPTAYACGCCLLISTKVLRKVGLMDEKYFAYYDEADWCSRMAIFGLNCFVVPDATLYHKVSRSTPNLISTYLITRNRFFWMRRYLSTSNRIRSYPYLLRELLSNLANACGLDLSGRHFSKIHSKIIVRAWFDSIIRKTGKWPPSIDALVAQTKQDLRDS